MSDIYKLQHNGMTLSYPGWHGYVSLVTVEQSMLLTPMTTFTWPSMSNGCFTINSNIVNCYGVSGWKEVLYKTVTVAETGDYTLELDWTSSTGLTFWSGASYQRKFGLWFDTSLNLTLDNNYQGAMAQGILMQDYNDTSVITKSQTATLNLTAGTTYYVWLSYSVLDDARNQTIEFTKLKLTKA